MIKVSCLGDHMAISGLGQMNRSFGLFVPLFGPYLIMAQDSLCFLGPLGN